MYYSLVIVGITIVVFILQAVIPGFTELFILDSSKVIFQPWRLLTAIFLHGGVGHIMFNMFGLALFGTILESVIGKKRFLLVYFLGGLFASVGATLLYNRALGASGALFAVLGTLAVLRPHLQVWVTYIPMPMYMAAVVWVFLDLIGLFIPNGVANLAHLAGIGFGLGLGFYWKSNYTRRAQPRAKPITLEEDAVQYWENRYMR